MNPDEMGVVVTAAVTVFLVGFSFLVGVNQDWALAWFCAWLLPTVLLFVNGFIDDRRRRPRR